MRSKTDYRIVFSDVDGTLLNSQHKVLPGTLMAIKALQAKGIPFVIVSARSPSGIRPIFMENGFSCPMICYSGALILDETGSVLYEEGLSRAFARRVIDCIEASRFDCTWNLYSSDLWIVKDRTDVRVRREEEIVQARAEEGTVMLLKPDARVGKILCMCHPSRILAIEEALKSSFPELSICRSSDILPEIMAPGTTKSNAVKRLCQRLEIPLQCAVAFGDHYNDVDMLETVAMSYLMGNAPEELRQRFPRITADNDHEGIYLALKETGII